MLVFPLPMPFSMHPGVLMQFAAPGAPSSSTVPVRYHYLGFLGTGRVQHLVQPDTCKVLDALGQVLAL